MQRGRGVSTGPSGFGAHAKSNQRPAEVNNTGGRSGSGVPTGRAGVGCALMAPLGNTRAIGALTVVVVVVNMLTKAMC